MKQNSFRLNDLFKYYLYWAVERQNIFWKRFQGGEFPYSDDDVFNKFKFTNTYRVLDRTTQYLLKNVIYNGKQYSKRSMFWRIIIFKHYNLPNTWDYLVGRLGDIDEHTDFEEITGHLIHYRKFGGRIYSNAYMMTASFLNNDRVRHRYGITTRNKHEAYMRIFHFVRNSKIDLEIIDSNSFEEVFTRLSSILTIGAFLAYQYTIDLNYSELFNFDENDFVAIGPGTKRGIDRTFTFNGRADYSGVVHWLSSNFERLLHEHGYKFKSLPGRYPTKTDLLNCFCETDKYLRTIGVKTEDKQVHGKRMKSYFRPNLTKIDYVFPPDWNIKLE